MMLTWKQKFSEFLEECSCSSLYTSEEISEMIAHYTSPCPSVSGALRQKYYRVRNNYLVMHSNSTNILYKANSPNLLKVMQGTNCSTYLRQYTVMMASTLGEIDSSQN